MTKLVDQWDRERAKGKAKELLSHQLNRVWDAQQEAEATLEAEKVAETITALNKLSSLVGTAQSLSQTWRAFFLDWQRVEEKEKAAITEAAASAEKEEAARAAADNPF